MEPWIEHPNVTAVSLLRLIEHISAYVTTDTGTLGRFTGDGSWHVHCGSVVRRLESIRQTAIYHRSKCFRLSCTACRRGEFDRNIEGQLLRRVGVHD